MTLPARDAVGALEVVAPVIGRTARELRDTTPEEPDWLIPGLLALGQTTEINGREKVGKGWFEAFLLGSLERGETTMFGENRVGPVRTLIYSEEPALSLREKLEAFDLNDSLVVFHYELAGNPWSRVVDYLVGRAVEGGYQVLFIDNISSATGTEDENGVELARHVEPLSRHARQHNLAVLYDRHQRKSTGDVRDLSRGGTALAGAVDQIVAISKGPNRERKLSGWGRMRASEWDKVVELAEDFSGYTDLGDADPRFDLLLSRPEWTVAEWEAASRLSNESARQYLEGSSSVMRSNEKRGRANIYTTIKPPELS